jgi:enoyl-CoA hydratase/carnithine racemase
MAMYEYRLDGHVALLTMNESKFNMSSVTEFLSVLNEIEKNTDAKALIVSSSDQKLWSTGLDLEWLTPLIQKGERGVADAFTAKLGELFKTMLFYPMITVAAITGHAFAGGAVLACCFDFRFMRKGRGYFCFPEVDLGIPFIPSFTALMKKAIPMDLVEDMQLTARRLTAEECEARHIIVKACSMDELMSEAVSFAKRLNKERPIVAKLKNGMHKDILRIMEVEDPVALKSWFGQ